MLGNGLACGLLRVFPDSPGPFRTAAWVNGVPASPFEELPRIQPHVCQLCAVVIEGGNGAIEIPIIPHRESADMVRVPYGRLQLVVPASDCQSTIGHVFP